MQVEGSVVLVTGANRGLGKTFAEAFLAAGSSKVYAGARNPAGIDNPKLVPVKLDVTSARDIADVSNRFRDVSILVNNAGVMLTSPMFHPDFDFAMRREMEVNVFGMRNMIAAFASALSENGGGAIVNMLSVVSWFVFPINATYCASKHAALAVSDSARIELKGQGTRVLGVYAGYIDTDMAAGIDAPKTSPQQVAMKTIEGLRNGRDHILADERAEEIWIMSWNNPAGLANIMQERWDKMDFHVGSPPKLSRKQ